MNIKPIKKVNVSEEVFNQMTELLSRGEWKQGDKIPSENVLAEMFGVSRVTVRQALQKLNVLGLIETRLGEGSFVKVIEPGDSMNGIIPTMYLSEGAISQIFEFREIIEVQAAKLATRRATKQGLAELKEIVEHMKESSGNLQMFAKADMDFHIKIGQMTQNDLIVKTYEILRVALQEPMTDIVIKTGYETGIYYHSNLVKTMESGDEQAAMDLMYEHMNNNVKVYRLIKEEKKNAL